jgi:hypothetical protein
MCAVASLLGRPASESGRYVTSRPTRRLQRAGLGADVMGTGPSSGGARAEGVHVDLLGIV